MNLDFSFLAKIENGKARLTEDMARACDEALDAGGALIHVWKAAQGSVRPAQLPAVPAQVVGRDAELVTVAAGVRDRPAGTPGVVAIDGPAGAGKTALALWSAHQIADQYVDGQLYADLGGFAPPGKSVTADVVLVGFLTAMGASSIPDTAAERAGLYRSMLAERNVLIVLDNVADLEDVTQLMPASAGCAVMVTSRRALSSLVTRVSATRVTVRPLSEPDSVSLVSRVIGEARTQADSDAVATLTRLCGHLPLALCIAAEQIAMYPHRQIIDLIDELIEEEHRLNAWENTDLRAVFSWSYHDLGEDAARLFRLIGLHNGPHLSVEAAAALAGLSVPRARRLLHRLASLHLVDVDSDGVIRLHDLIRVYARELVTTDEDDERRTAAVQRLVSWYAGTARAASLHLSPHMPQAPSAVDDVNPLVFTDDTAAWAWCTTELDNFGPITTLALQYGPPGVGHQLATGLADLGLLDRPAGGRAPQESASTTPGAHGIPGPKAVPESPGAPPHDTVPARNTDNAGGSSRPPWAHDHTGHWPPWADADGDPDGGCPFNGPWHHNGSGSGSDHGFDHGRRGGIGDMVQRAALAIFGDLGDDTTADVNTWPGPGWTRTRDGGPPLPFPRADTDTQGATPRPA